MKSMVDQLVYEVRSDHQNRSISTSTEVPALKKESPKKSNSHIVGFTCPKCKNGTLVKGSKAYGCTAHKNGCNFLLPFRFMEKKISDNQYLRLLKKSETVQLKGFNNNGQKTNGKICFDDQFNLKLEQKTATEGQKKNKCPKCTNGELIKGNKAYGCSNYKNGCDFVFPFDKIRSLAQGKPLTAELVNHIMSNY